MERINTSFLLLGPTSSGKLTLARKWIEEAHGGKIELPLETRTFNIGDGYEWVGLYPLYLNIISKYI